MKILLLTGLSGVGKTSVAKGLFQNTDKYNLVCSYTDRPKRDKADSDHTFIEASYMDSILEREDIVASTVIDNYRYCSLSSQFDEDKVNIYVSDLKGINDTFDYFPYADIMTVLIQRDGANVDLIRQERDVLVPARDDVDFAVANNYKLSSTINTIDLLVSFDLFRKPSHKVETVNDKLDYISEQYRYLNEIKSSLLKQLWYMNQSSYIKMCKYVEEKVNEEYEKDIISIVPDTEPVIEDSYLLFEVIGNPSEDLKWVEMERINERISYYATSYCDEHNLDDILYRLCIVTDYEDDYV